MADETIEWSVLPHMRQWETLSLTHDALSDTAMRQVVANLALTEYKSAHLGINAILERIDANINTELGDISSDTKKIIDLAIARSNTVDLAIRLASGSGLGIYTDPEQDEPDSTLTCIRQSLASIGRSTNENEEFILGVMSLRIGEILSKKDFDSIGWQEYAGTEAVVFTGTMYGLVTKLANTNGRFQIQRVLGGNSSYKSKTIGYRLFDRFSEPDKSNS